jgi:exonuclease SbcC
VRPLSLEIQGFTSFRELQTVKFDDLGLFVITGPTGVGKTSILDAMALALYGAVPRMGKSGLGALISHGQAEARVLLVFSVDGQRYRVSRRLRRKGAQQGRLERLEGGEWVDAASGGGITDINGDIRKLVKLDFESFCKAVVLPQGEFARFLKGDPKERRSTLVELLGLGHYERMRALAGERAREMKIRTQQTQELLDTEFADATDEAVAECQGVAQSAALHAQALAKALDAARDLARERTEHEASRNAAQALAGDLRTLSADLDARQAGCRSAEAAYRSALVERDAAQRVAEEAAGGLAGAEAELAANVDTLGTAEDLTRLIDAARSLPKLAEERAAADVSATAMAEQHAAAMKESSELEAAVAEADAARSEAGAERERAETDHATADEARRTAERRLEEARRATTASERAAGDLAAARAAHASAAADAESAAAGMRIAEDEMHSLEREHAAAALAAGLAPGDPCPVCDRPLDEHPHLDPDVEAKLEAARSRAATARASATSSEREVAAAAARAEAAEQALAVASAALEEALAGAPHVQSLEEAQGATSARLHDSATRRDLARAEEHKAAAALAALREQLAGAAQRRDGLAAQHAQCVQAAERASVAHDTAAAMLAERFGEPVPPDAAVRLDADREALNRSREAVDAARARERTAREELMRLERAVTEAQQALTAVDLALQDLHSRLAAARERALSDGTALQELPQPVEARDTRAAELAGWALAAAVSLDDAAGRAAAAADHLAERIVAAASARGVATSDPLAAVEALAGRAGDAMTEKGAAEQAARALEAKLRSRRGLEERIAGDTQKAAILDVVARELRADHFVEFLIQETLDLLAARASDELWRISGHRYTLVSADGEFSVIDHINADEQRSVKTLSGGETFMASLSLALALSQHVSDLAGEGLGARLQAVFIDEGFGSLDAETLDEVIDALERLRDAELLVGVISHVPEVAARIGDGLDVQRDGSRSVIAPRMAA